MIYALILFLLACFFAGSGFSISANSAVQQTVQYLEFAIAAIFLTGSFILIKLSHIEKTLSEKNKGFIQPELKN